MVEKPKVKALEGMYVERLLTTEATNTGEGINRLHYKTDL